MSLAQPLRAFWDARQRREKLVLVLAGIALLALLYDSLIYQPLATARQQANTQLEANRELVAWMSEAVTTLQARGGGSPGTSASGSGQSPMIAAERLAREAGVAEALQRREPAGRQGVRVAFEAVPFNDLIRWMALMQSREGLTVNRARMVPVEDQPGRVDVEISLERPS